MKNFIILFLFCAFHGVSQEKWSCSNGQVGFEASIPSFEEVKALNNKVLVSFNTNSGTLTSTLDIKDFKFKINLMEKHFNDSYMESDRYPKASFKGKIEDFNVADINTISKEYFLKGKIKIHGKTKELNCVAKIRKTEYGIEMKMDYELDASDFNIKIPFLVRNKVSNKIKVTNNFLLK